MKPGADENKSIRECSVPCSSTTFKSAGIVFELVVDGGVDDEEEAVLSDLLDASGCIFCFFGFWDAIEEGFGDGLAISAEFERDFSAKRFDERTVADIFFKLK